MLEIAEISRRDADLEGAGLELADEVPRPPRQPPERLELRVEPGEELVRLEPPLALAQHHLGVVFLEQRDRVELRIQHPCDRVRLGERLANERERRRESDPVLERDALEV